MPTISNTITPFLILSWATCCILQKEHLYKLEGQAAQQVYWVSKRVASKTFESRRWTCLRITFTNYFLSQIRWHNPSGRTMALGSTLSLTEICTWNISLGVNKAGSYGWQSYHFRVPVVWKSGSLSHLELTGLGYACRGINLLKIFREIISVCSER
jgi:hypothetical protein